ncbi:DUF624 domain-containing protein [Bacillus salacetis]|uniref:DUF624 domain-containing protein n=1 Tax=Bacillus salacetis TaxID=2315464 RepID=A0A3A1R2C3_9BACI|nr:DUF624 domain-containing protein [Bacillus salacetis]RIW34235.1 DUF624 domain-containing protein [Bacillus salacetis]
MELDGFAGGLYKVSFWISRFFYLNFLWVLSILLGGVLLGVFPGLVATLVISRKWIEGKDVRLNRVFWKGYFEEFWKSNAIGWFFIGIMYVLYIDFQYIKTVNSGVFSILMYVGLITISILAIGTLIYVFPILAQHKLKTFETLKYSCIIGMVNPLHSLILGIIIYLGISLINDLPILILFIGGVVGYIWMWFAKQSIESALRKPSFG